MKIIKRAEHSGFCFGVKRAIEMAEKATESIPKGESIYTWGPLIHNDHVTRELKKKGIEEADSFDKMKEGDCIIIRSHGVGKSFYEEASKRKLAIIDATCPFVKKIHNIVEEYDAKGYRVIIAGDREHPEVEGIKGWCKDRAIVVANEKEACGEELAEDGYILVSQTTLQQSEFKKIEAALRKRIAEIENEKCNNESKIDLLVKNTICDATEKRQNSCMELSKEMEVMLIIGGKNSSNSKKLYDLSKKNCKKSFFIQDIEDLPLKDIRFCNKIGVVAGASTPEHLIKEVISSMSEQITENNETNIMHDLMEEIEKSIRLPKGGEIVEGTVILVSDKEVIVNLGCKKDGIVPKEEVVMEENQTLKDLFKEGDKIQAKVVKTDNGDGNILLSKKKLEIGQHWNEINEAYENKVLLDVKVVKEVRGGVLASYKEVVGFIPYSQLSNKYVDKADEFIGKQLTVLITRVDQKKGRVVFSHKAHLQAEREKKLEEIWTALSEGDIVEGTVMRFTEYGAFVDIGGIDGLLHISEISWGKLKHPKEVLTIGEKIPVKILGMDRSSEKISLGYKQTQPEPWSLIDEKYKEGEIVEGTVVQIKEYGAFIEIAPGLDGLVHISEISHSHVDKIENELSLGQEIKAKIIEIDRERRRIGLSIKETIERPIYEKSEEAKEEAEEAVEVSDADADAE